MKYREFWLEVNEYADEDTQGEACVWSHNPDYLYQQMPIDAQSPIIHVIDHAAYTDALKMLEEMARTIENYCNANNVWSVDKTNCWYEGSNEQQFLDIFDKYKQWKDGAK